MRKAIYKGTRAAINPNIICNITIIYNGDDEYFYVYYNGMKIIYDNREDIEKEWEFVND